MSQSQRFQQPKLVDAGDHGEGESMSAVLLNPLNDLQTIAQALFISLGPSHSKPLPPPPPPSAILACDQAISDALSTAHLHQIKQRRIEALKQEIVEMDATWKDICIELETGKRELEELLKESDERLEAIEKAKTASVPYPELLAYAQRLSAFTAAPPNLTDENLLSQQPGPLFFPPFPNEEKMRRGRLNAEAPLALLGEVHSVGKPQTTSPRLPDPHLAHGANPYRRDIRPSVPQQAFDFDLDLNPDF